MGVLRINSLKGRKEWHPLGEVVQMSAVHVFVVKLCTCTQLERVFDHMQSAEMVRAISFSNTRDFFSPLTIKRNSGYSLRQIAGRA